MFITPVTNSYSFRKDDLTEGKKKRKSKTIPAEPEIH